MMDKKQLKYILHDLRYFRLFPKRYKTTQIADPKARHEYWHKVSHDYWNFKKRVDCTDFRWFVITYKDGHKELAYFKIWRISIPHGGRLCRGLIPRYFGVYEYEHVESIRLAF